MVNFATPIVEAIREAFPGQPDWRFVTGVAEETGEFVSEFCRFVKIIDKPSTLAMREELADIVITANMAADVLDIDLVRVVKDIKISVEITNPKLSLNIWQYILELSAKSGEFIGAYNRFTGTSRRLGTYEEMAIALGWVILAAYNVSVVLNIDLNADINNKLIKMNSRGWKNR